MSRLYLFFWRRPSRSQFFLFGARYREMRVLITGASRGIGAAVAKAFAKKHGARAKIALLARSRHSPSHPALNGTLDETCRSVQSFGGTAVPVSVDMRDDPSLTDSVDRICKMFSGLDVLVLNASSLSVNPRPKASTIDWLFQTNIRSSLRTLQACHGHLSDSRGSVVSISPPVRMGRLNWISDHPAYTISKYGMTMATLAHADDRVRACTLWPRHTISTEATRYLETKHGFVGAHTLGRSPSLFAEAVHKLATDPSKNATCLFDDDVIDMGDTYAPLDAFAEEKNAFPSSS